MNQRFRRLFTRKPKVESGLYYLGGEILFTRKQLYTFAVLTMEKYTKIKGDCITHADIENFIHDLKQ